MLEIRVGHASGPGRLAVILVATTVALVALAGCKKTSHAKATSSSTTSTAAASSTAQSSTTNAPSATSTPTTSGGPVLSSDVCSMLSAGTVGSVLGISASSTRNVASEGDDSGGCIWGTLSTSLQVTAFTGAQLAQRKLQWQATVPSVGGVGNGAWSRGPLTIANLDSVVLYVDYGDFGLEFAANAARRDGGEDRDARQGHHLAHSVGVSYGLSLPTTHIEKNCEPPP